MRAHWLGYSLIAVVGVVVGAWGSDWIDRREPGNGSAPAASAPTKPDRPKKKRTRKREVVKERPRTLAAAQLQALGYVDGTYDPEGDVAERKRRAIWRMTRFDPEALAFVD